jgi:Mg2+/Co2+ transporter CorB
MPVRIRAKLKLRGVVTPQSLNAETDVISLQIQPNEYIIEGFISLRNIESDDIVVIREYITVDGVNSDLSDEITVSGVLHIPIVRIPAMTLSSDAKFRVTVTQTSGTTIKSFPYVFILQALEEI